MTKTFTENDLVRLLYGELNKEEEVALKCALVKNPELKDQLNDLQEVVGGLNKVKYRPSRKSIDYILGFSKGYEVQSI